MDVETVDIVSKVQTFLEVIEAKSRAAKGFIATHESSKKKVFALERQSKSWKHKITATDTELRVMYGKVKMLEARNCEYKRKMNHSQRKLSTLKERLQELYSTPYTNLGIDSNFQEIVSEVIAARSDLTACYSKPCTCDICGTMKAGVDMVYNNKCVHTACKYCMTQILQSTQPQARCGFCRGVCTRFFTLVNP